MAAVKQEYDYNFAIFDTPVRAVLYPALFREGPDAAEPLDLSGTFRDDSGEVVTARSALSVTVPANGFRILKKA